MVDTENVLVYNLGPACLAPAGARDVRFVRNFTEPPRPPVTLDPPGAHYLEYGLTTSKVEDSTKHRALLANWRDVPWPVTRGVPQVGALWLALRSSRPGVFGRLHDPLAPFGVSIEIGTSDATPHPVHVLKPLP